MTRRDYVELADAVRAGYDICKNRDEKVGAEIVARTIADLLASNSGAFDRELFLTNCGVKQ